MTEAAGISGTIAGWVEFFFTHVLPIAVSQIYDWLRDWQTLVAVVLVVLAGQLWARFILKSARKAARETVQSETRAIDASLKLLRRQIDLRSEQGARSQPVPAPRPSEPPPGGAACADGRVAVGQLRQAIRLALGTIPLSDDSLSPEGERLYKAAIGSLSGLRLPPNARSGVLGQILTDLSALEQDFPPISCRQAWQALVRVNALAREFDEPPLTRAQVLAAGAKTSPQILSHYETS